MSIFQALDLKHEYLREKLAKIPFPPPNALYLDTDHLGHVLSTKALATYEWTKWMLTRSARATRKPASSDLR